MPTGAWLEDEIFVLGVWGIIPNKQNMKSCVERDFFILCVCIYKGSACARKLSLIGDNQEYRITDNKSD